MPLMHHDDKPDMLDEYEGSSRRRKPSDTSAIEGYFHRDTRASRREEQELMRAIREGLRKRNDS